MTTREETLAAWQAREKEVRALLAGPGVATLHK